MLHDCFLKCLCICVILSCLSAQQNAEVAEGESIPSVPLIPLLPSHPIEVRGEFREFESFFHCACCVTSHLKSCFKNVAA